MLRAGCRVIVERHAKDELPEEVGTLRRAAERRYGETAVTWYEARAGRPAAEGDPTT